MPTPLAARNAVATVFALNGFAFASLAARIPDLRGGLGLDNSALGSLLLAIAAGSLVALAASGRLVERWGAGRVVLWGGVACAVGLAVVALGVSGLSSVVLTTVGLFVYGAGSGAWDVAMNVEGAAVERLAGRTLMPRFHAGWSLGSIAGAGAGVVVIGLATPLWGHLSLVGVLTAAAALVAVRHFLPGEPVSAATRAQARQRSAWREPRTLLVGVLVLCFGAAEGAANDWLTLALIDGYDAPQWLGVAGFGVFVAAMTGGRLVGPIVLDRFGRVPVLLGSALLATVGVTLVVLGGLVPLVALGILLWGLGASLGFPVGMSAAADDPVGAAPRVAVVATIGYGAFLAGPPLFGLLGDAVGTLDALLAVTGLMAVSLLAVGAAGRPVRRDPHDTGARGDRLDRNPD